MEPRSTHEAAPTEAAANPSRRTFLQKVGTGGVLLGAAALGFEAVRALVPDVVNEAPQRFKLGLPAQIPDGLTFIEDKKLYIVREGKSFHAISAACTHLGCTVKHVNLNQPKTVEVRGETKTVTEEFLCPCHGSKYDADGTNYAGPAPRSLRWYKLEISPDDGQLIADLGSEVDQYVRLTV